MRGTLNSSPDVVFAEDRIAATSCESGEETAGQLHQVPHYPIGENPFVGEQAKQSGVPVEALMGGPETTYSEYRQRLPRPPASR